jgi:hypothetical protein
MLPAIVSSRIRWATNPDVLISNMPNMRSPVSLLFHRRAPAGGAG